MPSPHPPLQRRARLARLATAGKLPGLAAGDGHADGRSGALVRGGQACREPGWVHLMGAPRDPPPTHETRVEGLPLLLRESACDILAGVSALLGASDTCSSSSCLRVLDGLFRDLVTHSTCLAVQLLLRQGSCSVVVELCASASKLAVPLRNRASLGRRRL
eukprot:scaffold1607_cov417-Prasinococcus_capsulatus_cf.AAC.5